MLSNVLTRVGLELQSARKEPFASHPLASFIRDAACSELSDVLGPTAAGLQFKGSPGQGNWATIPWLAVFNPVVTTSAERGYYVVYLFHANEPRVYLSLIQGTTAVRKEFGRATRQILRNHANSLITRIPEFIPEFSPDTFELGSGATLPRDYEAGHVLGCCYDLTHELHEDNLRRDLQRLVQAYISLTFRGGLDPSPETRDDDDLEIGEKQQALIEIRRYKLHRRIERSQRAKDAAKRAHGTRCKACSLDFSEKYGELGSGFIEAHHMRPLAALEEGTPVTLDPETDLTVLCANCHRMIHRLDDPSDLEELRRSISELPVN